MPRLVHDDLYMGYYGSLTTILWNGNDYPHLTEDKIDLREIMELVRGHVAWKWLSWDLKPGLTGSDYVPNTSYKPNPRVVSAELVLPWLWCTSPVHTYVLRHTVWSPRHPLYWCVGWRSLKTIVWDSKQEKESTKEAKTLATEMMVWGEQTGCDEHPGWRPRTWTLKARPRKRCVLNATRELAPTSQLVISYLPVLFLSPWYCSQNRQ